MKEIEGFNFYTDVLDFGNRNDIELGNDRWLSWEAEDPIPVKEGTSTSTLILTDNDGNQVARFLVAWSRVA
jgi:hypothetical protein